MPIPGQKDELIWDNNMHILFGTNPLTWTNNYKGFADCLVPDDAKIVSQILTYCIKNNVPYVYSFRLTSRPGVHIRGMGKCFYKPDGLPYRFLGVCIDDSARPCELLQFAKKNYKDITEGDIASYFKEKYASSNNM